MNGNLRFGQLFGIPFFVNPSWFLVLALGTFSFAQSFIRIPSIGSLGGLAWGGAIALGLLTTLLLFASVLAHELGHSAAAIAQGIEVKSITLFIFGGLAMLEKDASTPMKSLAIAIAGPLVSFALFFLFFFTQRGLQGLPLPVTVILTTLASLNLVLGLFNLIPGMPLDGGNILRAIIWQVTGNASTGLLYASRVGQGFGGFAIALGLLGEFGISPYGSLWTAFIGAFLLQNAGRSAQSAQVQNKLNQYKAEDAMITAPSIVPGDRSLRSFVNDFVIGKDPVPFYIVTDEQGKYLGIIQADDLKTIATSLWTDITLLDVLRDRSGNSETINLTQIQGQTPLLELVPLIEKNPNQPLLVLNEHEQALGLLTKNSIRDRLVADNPPNPKTVEPSAE